MGLHCLPRPELLKAHSFRLFSCFKLEAATCYCLLIEPCHVISNNVVF